MNKEGGNVAIAVSIIIAGILIAAAVIFTGGGTTVEPQGEDIETQELTEDEIKEALTVKEGEAVRGSQDPEVTIFEYSDTECPFCKVVHGTLQQLVSEYDNLGWVYRHVPLHRKSLVESNAVECAGQLGGSDAYIQYLDLVFENTQGNDSLDLNLLPQFATDLGLNEDEFVACLNDGGNVDKIRAQGDEAFALGAKGTPFSVIVDKDGNRTFISGAQPIDVWRSAIDSLLE